jgi:acetyl-CoA synthetase
MLINNHHHPLLRWPLRTGSMGQPMPGWKAALLSADSDEPVAVEGTGRVAMDLTQSPLSWFDGYVEDAASTSAKFSSNGRWYITGDTARMDKDGNFYFCARDDDVIIMAGYRIGPFEVESVLLAHAAVSECAVVAASDEIRGEVLEAAIILRTGYVPCKELTIELQEWVKRRYAAHAYPRHIHYLESLPKTPSGKLQRFILRRQLSGARRGQE